MGRRWGDLGPGEVVTRVEVEAAKGLWNWWSAWLHEAIVYVH